MMQMLNFDLSKKQFLNDDMMNELIPELTARGADFVRVVDVSMLPASQTRGYGIALLIGMALSPGYISSLSKDNFVDNSEFSLKEHLTDELADWLADAIIAKGYKASSQSERVLIEEGFYNETTKTAILPHKTIAHVAGMGWIGKNNLLVTREYGSALCMSTVLTNAPIPTKNRPNIKSECGNCTICRDVCQVKALYGTKWEIGIDRDSMLDVYHCNSCLKCLAKCPWTQKYMHSKSSI